MKYALLSISLLLILILPGCVNAKAELDTKIEGIAAGIAGKIEKSSSEIKQDLKAGHDVNNITQQFTKEVLESIRSTNRTNAWNTSIANLVVLGVMLALIIAAAVVICVLFNKSRVRADDRARMAMGKLERALTLVPPSEADRVFPKNDKE